jgi:hypothetical protein
MLKFILKNLVFIVLFVLVIEGLFYLNENFKFVEYFLEKIYALYLYCLRFVNEMTLELSEVIKVNFSHLYHRLSFYINEINLYVSNYVGAIKVYFYQLCDWCLFYIHGVILHALKCREFIKVQSNQICEWFFNYTSEITLFALKYKIYFQLSYDLFSLYFGMVIIFCEIKYFKVKQSRNQLNKQITNNQNGQND